MQQLARAHLSRSYRVRAVQNRAIWSEKTPNPPQSKVGHGAGLGGEYSRG